MLKNIKPINNYLNNWLKENNFDCTVQFDADFSFDCLNDILHYTFVVLQDHDRLFLEVCREICPEIEESDNFILSFFHELGHFETQHLFSDEEWDKYDELCDIMSNMDELTDKNYLDYYHYPIEIEATKWGCEYIVNNIDKVKEWWNNLKPLITNFMLANNIEDNDFSEYLKENK